MGRLFYETLSPALFCSQKTVSRLSYYTIIYAVTANRSWLGCQCLFYQHNILNLCAVTVIQEKSYVPVNCVLTVTYTMEEIWHLANGFWFWRSARGHPLYTGRRQSNTADGRMDYMPVCHPRLFWKYQCASALNDIPCSMRWYLFCRLFLDTNRTIPVLPRRMVIRTMTSFSRKLTFTLSVDSLLWFFQLS